MKTVIGIVILLLIFAAVYIFVIGLAYLFRFKVKPCKYCGNFMVFRGEKERPEGNVYLFQCPECGAWDEVPVKEFHRLYESMSCDIFRL